MPRRLQTRFLACSLTVFAAAFFPAGAQSRHETKSVTNLEGGILQETDGAIPGGACFRLKLKLDAQDFFENLRREDTRSGTLYRRGNDIVTHFPKQLQVSLSIADFPRDLRLHHVGARVYLTDEIVGTLRLGFYWKRGLELRPVKGIEPKAFEVSPIENYARAADSPRQRHEWQMDFEVPSDGVPLTDSLVLVLRTPDQRIAARTAARL